MDSPPSTDAPLALLRRDGREARDGLEWATMLVEVHLPDGAWEDAALFRNGEPLPLARRVVGGRMRIVAEWPRTGCGSYRLLLREGHGRKYERIVDVFPRKIRRERFTRLLHDLHGELPASIALAMQRAGGLGGVELLPPAESTLAEEVQRLRRAIEGTPRRRGLAAVLAELSAEPHRVFHAGHDWAATERARRPVPAMLTRALTHGRSLGPDGRPAQVLDTRVEHTADVYENQLVNAFVLMLERRIRALGPTLRRFGGAAMRRDVDRLTETLRAARRRASFLDDVGELERPPERVSMVLLKRPAYRAALESYLDFHRRLRVRLEDAALDAPLENLPTLYQVWGTLQVIRALIDTGGRLGYRVENKTLVTRAKDGLVVRVLRNGEVALKMAHPDGIRAELLPEPSYHAKKGAIRSFTYPQRPDVAVVVRRPDAAPRLFLFDPKYKLDGEPLEAEVTDEAKGPKPQKVDIDKMHAYRDAIRTEGGERVVEYAAILYPGPHVPYEYGGIEALSAVPGEGAALDERLEAVLREALAV